MPVAQVRDVPPPSPPRPGTSPLWCNMPFLPISVFPLIFFPLFRFLDQYRLSPRGHLRLLLGAGAGELEEEGKAEWGDMKGFSFL